LHGNTPYKCKVTVDGTDFRLRDPTGYDKRFFSHKFKTAGLRYEMAVCIETGHIVWINGPFPCGSFADITIFRSGLKWALDCGERVEADAGYRGEPLFISIPEDYDSEEHRKSKSRARARHEQINRRLKNFECLHQLFRHNPVKHSDVFWSVAVIVQLSLFHSEKTIWNVNYIGQCE
jgi:DDE superfamily endonuclease